MSLHHILVYGPLDTGDAINECAGAHLTFNVAEWLQCIAIPNAFVIVICTIKLSSLLALFTLS